MTAPPFVDPKRWPTLVALCRQMDDRANRGAGAPRPSDTRTEGGKPVLTCGSGTDQAFDPAKLAPETSVPGVATNDPGTGRKPQGGPDDGRR